MSGICCQVLSTPNISPAYANLTVKGVELWWEEQHHKQCINEFKVFFVRYTRDINRSTRILSRSSFKIKVL